PQNSLKIPQHIPSNGNCLGRVHGLRTTKCGQNSPFSTVRYFSRGRGGLSDIWKPLNVLFSRRISLKPSSFWFLFLDFIVRADEPKHLLLFFWVVSSTVLEYFDRFGYLLEFSTSYGVFPIEKLKKNERDIDEKPDLDGHFLSFTIVGDRSSSEKNAANNSSRQPPLNVLFVRGKRKFR
ncbi:unnamed protein product, partial [Ectocarpus sp. 4 AP-2014]